MYRAAKEHFVTQNLTIVAVGNWKGIWQVRYWRRHGLTDQEPKQERRRAIRRAWFAEGIVAARATGRRRGQDRVIKTKRVAEIAMGLRNEGHN
jgi:hypothetical protein